MGWSCSAKASYTLEAITKLIDRESSNDLPGGIGFFEASREEWIDGSITGTVWKFVAANRASSAGSFKISGEGKIVRFPLLPKEIKAWAEALSAVQYKKYYGGIDASV